MKVEIQKTYKIGENTFSSLEEANKFLLEEIYNSGLEEILKNPNNFIQALKTVINPGNPEKTTYSNTGKPTLKEIQEYLRNQGYKISRHEKFWPVYEILTPEKEEKIIRYTGKVHELHSLILEIGIEEVISKYTHKL